jgi:hypothetical protein
MSLLVFQIALLVFGSLFLIMSAGEKNSLNRCLDSITGIALYVFLFVTLAGGM